MPNFMLTVYVNLVTQSLLEGKAAAASTLDLVDCSIVLTICCFRMNRFIFYPNR